MHKTANVLNKLPKSQQSKAKRALQEIWMAETKKDAFAAFEVFIETWGVKYDKAVGCLVTNHRRRKSSWQGAAQNQIDKVKVLQRSPDADERVHGVGEMVCRPSPRMEFSASYWSSTTSRPSTNPLDAVVMPDVRGQRRAAPAHALDLPSWLDRQRATPFHRFERRRSAWAACSGGSRRCSCRTVVDVRLVLDRAAERDRQRKGGEQGRERAWPR